MSVHRNHKYSTGNHFGLESGGPLQPKQIYTIITIKMFHVYSIRCCLLSVSVYERKSVENKEGSKHCSNILIFRLVSYAIRTDERQHSGRCI
jgi:hypothetical protein